MLRQIDWWVQNGPITKNGVLPATTSFFWKFYFSLRTSYKELIWCTNYPNIHISTFCELWSFIWRCFSPVSILKDENIYIFMLIVLIRLFHSGILHQISLQQYVIHVSNPLISAAHVSTAATLTTLPTLAYHPR